MPGFQHPCSPGAGQGKVVTSLDVDHSGSRLLAGSRDYSLRMFDFNGMKSDMRSFRRLEPSDGHPVHSVSLSPTGRLHCNKALTVLWQQRLDTLAQTCMMIITVQKRVVSSTFLHV